MYQIPLKALTLIIIYILTVGCNKLEYSKEDKTAFTSLLSTTGYRYKTDVCRLVGNIEGAEEVLTVDSYRVFTVPVIQPVYD